MNRRNFIRGLLAVGAGFTILPGAARTWKTVRGLSVPECSLTRATIIPMTPEMFDMHFKVEKAFYGTVFYGKPIPEELKAKFVTIDYEQAMEQIKL